ncbi:hypothetical protein DL96DRAFT_1578984 [Flagelloscypha sp. PMI_526]|nr:hypothetical protein DL96DRAFT_1578984 [Flagelloscypha sp. PMI_526]
MSTMFPLLNEFTPSEIPETEANESPFETLAPEIIHYILDIATLPSDKATLYSLCLVSKASYYITSTRLYRTISLHSDIDISHFWDALVARPTLGLFTHTLSLCFTSKIAQVLSLEKLLDRLPNIRTLHLRSSSSFSRLPTTHPTLHCVYFGYSEKWDVDAIFHDPCSYITHLAVSCPRSHLEAQLWSIRFAQLTHVLFTNPWPSILDELRGAKSDVHHLSRMSIFPALPSSVQMFIFWDTGLPSRLNLLSVSCKASLGEFAIGKADPRFLLAAPEPWGAKSGDIKPHWTNWVLVWNFARRGPWFTGKWTIWNEAEQFMGRRASLRENQRERGFQ